MSDLQLLLRKYLYDTRSRRFFMANNVLAIVTIASLVNFVLETMPELSLYADLFIGLEWVFVTIFALEYIARILAVEKKRTYIFSLYGVIDLLSFIPTILGVGNFTFLKAVRAVRIMQLLRMVRIAKIRRMGVEEVEESLSILSLNILIYTTALTFALLVVGVGIYFFEGTAGTVNSIPSGMLWALVIFLDQINFTYPVTQGGMIMLGLARFLSLALFGVLIGILGNVMKHYLYNDGVRRKSLFVQ